MKVALAALAALLAATAAACARPRPVPERRSAAATPTASPDAGAVATRDAPGGAEDGRVPAPDGVGVPAGEPSAARTEGHGSSASGGLAFADGVAPMLARRCAPCHVPNGKMYATHPFDDPDTVLHHRDGILQRIKDGGDRALLERWLANAPD